MRYKIKTDLLEGWSSGDIIHEHTALACGLSEVIDRMSDWFEAVPNAQAGQYWEIESDAGKLNAIKRVQKVDGDTIHHKRISDGYEDFCSKTAFLAHCRKLSDDQVEQALTEEAKRRGLLSQGTKIETLDADPLRPTWIRDCWKFEYDPVKDVLFVHDRMLYKQGNWAEAISDEWEVVREEIGCSVQKGDIHTVKGYDFYLNEKEAKAIAKALNNL